MLNIKQLDTIIDMLTNKKNKISNDIAKLNKEIRYKQDLINKINQYQIECSNLNAIKHTHVFPMFIANRSMFSNRIFQLVSNEKHEINNLNTYLQQTISAYKDVDNHLSVFNKFKENIKNIKDLNEMRQEMIKMEDNINFVRAQEDYDRL